MSLSAGQLLNKRYRIEQQIGQGGFGDVYRTYDVTLRQPCAIKENLNTGAEAQRQFEREALILARLRHRGERAEPRPLPARARSPAPVPLGASRRRASTSGGRTGRGRRGSCRDRRAHPARWKAGSARLDRG